MNAKGHFVSEIKGYARKLYRFLFPGHTAPITLSAITLAESAMIGKTSIAPAMKPLHHDGEGDDIQ